MIPRSTLVTSGLYLEVTVMLPTLYSPHVPTSRPPTSCQAQPNKPSLFASVPYQWLYSVCECLLSVRSVISPSSAPAPKKLLLAFLHFSHPKREHVKTVNHDSSCSWCNHLDRSKKCFSRAVSSINLGSPSSFCPQLGCLLVFFLCLGVFHWVYIFHIPKKITTEKVHVNCNYHGSYSFVWNAADWSRLAAINITIAKAFKKTKC